MQQLMISTDIYDSLEALDAYLATVRQRRNERKQGREALVRFAQSIERIGVELVEAEQDEDADIASELLFVLSEFERRRREIESQFAFQLEAITKLLSFAAPEPIIDPAPLEQIELSLAPEPAAAPSLTAAEIEAITGECDAEIESLQGQVAKLLDAALPEDSAAGHQFRIRSVACAVNALSARAGEVGLADRFRSVTRDLRDRLDFRRSVTCQDQARPLPFIEGFCPGGANSLTSSQWEAAALLYGGVAEAQEAFDWLMRERGADGNGRAELELLNSIGARQQLLFRTLDEFGSTDRLQITLFGSIRDAASTLGYLDSLNVETPTETLERLAEMLPALRSAAELDLQAARDKHERVQRKEQAIAAVLAWAEAVGAGADGRNDKPSLLLPLLDECLAAGVPPTNAKVRGALLESGPALLEGLPKYAKLLEAVMAERKRQCLDGDEVEASDDSDNELPDEEFAAVKTAVAQFAAGRKVLLLGGTPKLHARDGLQAAIGCAGVEWPASRHGDRAAKFHTQVKRADLVIMAKNYASHEMSNKSREWAKELGKAYVLLPSGYGVKQIINQIFQQVVKPM